MTLVMHGYFPLHKLNLEKMDCKAVNLVKLNGKFRIPNDKTFMNVKMSFMLCNASLSVYNNILFFILAFLLCHIHPCLS